jgi:hypothetical protein
MIKYPKSINGQQCIGPCVDKDTLMIHPLSSWYTKGLPTNYCPIATIQPSQFDERNIALFGYDKNNLSYDQIYNLKNFAPCNHSTNISDMEDRYTEPTLALNSLTFLRLFYQINSFDDTIQWLEDNKHAQPNTKKRLLNSSWKAFGNNKNNITDRVILYYHNMIKSKWINTYYKSLYKYLSIHNNTIIVSMDNTDYNNEITLKMNFIMKNYITNNIIRSILQNIMKIIDDTNHSDINIHFDNYICGSILKKIEHDIKLKIKN